MTRAFLLAATIMVLALLGGCAFPLSPFVDTEPTGAIKPVASPLSSELDSEDWRIAEPILAQALRSSAPEATITMAARWPL